jgi:hypothetical protein
MQDNLDPASPFWHQCYFGLFWFNTKQILVLCPYDKEVHGLQGMEQQSRRRDNLLNSQKKKSTFWPLWYFGLQNQK